MMRKGKVRKGDGKDVHHTDRKNLSPSGLKVVSKSKNRSFKVNRGH